MEIPSVVMIMCYRPFDIRLLITSGIINSLSQSHRLILLLPRELIPIVKKDLSRKIFLEEIKYHHISKFGKDTRSKRKLREKIDMIIQKILYFTYSSARSNLTQGFLSKSFLKSCQRKQDLLIGYMIIVISRMASNIRLLRRFLQMVGRLINTPSYHADIFDRYKPNVLIVCSLGISLDALIMREARKANTPIMSIIQSWDKTSSKGYPLIPPDKVIVWSHIMAEETECYHDIARERILIGGVPQWDSYFRNDVEMLKERFLRKYKLSADRKIIYFGLCSMAYHKGNLDVITYLIECIDNKIFAMPSQIIFRPHPAYYGGIEEEQFETQYAELIELINRNRNNPHVRFVPPRIIRGDTAYISPEDNLILKELLFFSDVCVSVLSTQMIEAAILDKPVVTLEYGVWKTSEMEVELDKLKLEHIRRVFETGAISRSRTKKQLVENINEALLNPEKFSGARRRLADREVPVNRGKAALVVARIISEHANRYAQCQLEQTHKKAKIP